MKAKRLERLLKLIQALESGRSLSAEDLAKIVGVSRRTIFRDLDLLSQAGISCTYNHLTRRYSIDRVAHLPPVTLSHAEALALMMATRFVLGAALIPDNAAAASAALKLEGMLPAPMRTYCGSLLEQTEIRPPPASDVTSIADTLPMLQQAALRRNKVYLRYDSYFDREVIDAIVHPYRVVFIHRAWYMVGYSEPHKEVRTFKIERILQIKVLGARFRVREGFDLERYFGNAWMMIRGDQRYHVRIRFSPLVAGNVDEIIWHKTQRTRYEDDGSLLFEVDVDGVEEIAWWVLGYGDQAEVLEPDALRDIIVRRARNMLAMYQEVKEQSEGKQTTSR